MLGKNGSWLAGALVVLGLFVSQALADLATDPNGMSAWQGSQVYQGMFSAPKVDVEYCVYAPGQFDQSYPGEDPSNDAMYVYAYQILNTRADGPPDGYVSGFSVGLDQDAEAYFIGFVDDVLGQDPDNWHFAPSTAKWDYETKLAYGSISDILIFCSPQEPKWNDAALSGNFPAVGSLPSPVPEPTTICLLSLAAGGLVLRRRR